MKPFLLIVDDQDGAFKLLDLVSEDDFRLLDCDVATIKNPVGWIRDEKKYNELIHWLTYSAPSDLAVLLDLNFGGAESWQTVIDLLERYPAETIKCNIECRSGFAVLRALIDSTAVSRCFVLVASGGKLLNVPETIDDIIKEIDGINKELYIEYTARTAVNDQHGLLLKKLRKKWQDRFPEFHKAPFVDALIREWFMYFHSLDESTKNCSEATNAFCGHNHIESNTEGYARILAKSLA
jgi:hypothetical protein